MIEIKHVEKAIILEPENITPCKNENNSETEHGQEPINQLMIKEKLIQSGVKCSKCQGNHNSYNCVKSLYCNKCGKNGHRTEKCGIKCNSCGKLGHTQEKCIKAHGIKVYCTNCFRYNHNTEDCKIKNK